ncbi:MAG: TRAP transporter large permease subunit, partial [Desulfobacterales bacterium]|nr:TRAP transporter large permease subunit [Desulfobacterales bacterium]
KLQIDLVWFGVMIGMNLQTSFLTPPFGFALFYLRSVAAKSPYIDRVTDERISAVTTTQIYKGAFVFITLQVIMLALVIAFPGLVTNQIDKAPSVNLESIKLEAEQGGYGPAPQEPSLTPEPQPPGGGMPQPEAAAPQQSEDPMAEVMRALERDAQGKKK